MTSPRRAAGARRTARPWSVKSAMRSGWRVWISGAFLAVAIVFGGGGTPSPSTELVVEIAAIVAVVAWTWLAPRDRHYPARPIDWPLFVMAALLMAIPLLQLVPLPPVIWHNLPGREIEVQALALVGRDTAWMPLSEAPSRTIASALSLIPPIAMLFMVSRLRGRDRTTLIGVVAALGLLAAVVGVVQVVSGNVRQFRFYELAYYGFATGFQANRNANADILLIAALALVAWSVISGMLQRSRQAQFVIGALLLFLALSIVLTGSRTGVVLILVAIIAAAAMVFGARMWKNWRVGVAVALGIAAIGVSGALLTHNARVEQTMGRFSEGETIRPEIWKDTIYAIGQHWPAGSGIGTFQPIFAAAERLEFVRPDYSNRAHNDYLEFALEAGIVAPIFGLAVIIFGLLRLRRMLAPDASSETRIRAALLVGSLLILVLHSVVDYPERSLSLAVLTGLLCGLLGCVRPRVSEGVVG